MLLPPPAMGEPVRKKARPDDVNCDDRPEDHLQQLVLVQQHLLTKCLCLLPNTSLRKSLQGAKLMSEDERERDAILMFLSTVYLLCEVATKQSNKGFMCSNLSDVCDCLVRNEYGLVELLIDFLSSPDQFVSALASRSLSAFLVMCRSHVDPGWLDRLTETALLTSHPRKLSHSLEVIKQVVEWRDSDCHPLEDGTDDNLPVHCEQVSFSDAEGADSTHVKCVCIKALENRWPELLSKFHELIAEYVDDHESTVVTFLSLWQAIISVKANLSVADTKPFYARLENFAMLLSPSLPAVVWRKLLDLFNEVLCYGSTLALQEALAEEPCGLAHLVMRSVKDRRLLDALPFRSGSGLFGGGSNSVGRGDRPLLQKMSLLILKSVAVTVKETRCDSSSDASGESGMGSEEADADMAVIERSIKEVLRRLDSCVKSLLPFHPEAPVAQWIVSLFSDQDDALVESMVCCLDVFVGLSGQPIFLSPTHTFVAFIHTVSHDPDVLLDLLVSNETCFLLYLLRFLKFVRRNWPDFVSGCGRELDDTMTVLIRLRFSINRLVSKSLFPYNINPVLRLLLKTEEMYESNVN